MERKLVKQGRNALTMTLPASWIKANNLDENCFVYVEEIEGNLIVKSQNIVEQKKIEIDIKGMNKKNIYHNLSDKYIQGYDEIVLKHNNPEEVLAVSKNFTGMIIENLDDKSCVLKNIIAKPIDNYENILKRITQLLLDLAKKQVKYTKEKNSLNDYKRDDILLDTTILYAMRYINKYKIESDKDKQKHLLLLYSIETIGDMLKNISECIYGRLEIANKIVILIDKYITSIHLKDYKKVYCHIKEETKSLDKITYIDGLYFALTEIISNYIGYILEKN
jgi:phosphate uptake regulator